MKALGAEALVLQNHNQSVRVWVLFAATICLVALHGAQSIVFSSWRNIPGGLDDARLTNCILEHDYQSVLGHARLCSPSQFHPTKGTLVYGDNHFGTFLAYAGFRFLGASMEGAFQSWILIMLCANAASALFLFHRLKIHPLVACPAAFFATSSSALAFKMGHPQILPFFPFILALSFFIAFLKTADLRQLCWTAVFTAYQFFCYLYDGYFSLLIFGSVAIVAAFTFLGRDFWRSLKVSFDRDWRWFCFFSVLLIVAVTLDLYPYARFSSASGTRSMRELIGLAPNLGAWFSASHFSVFYAAQQYYKPDANIGENTLFSGWIAWVLLFTSIFAALRYRHDKDLRLAGVLAVSCLLIIGFVTTWCGSQGSAYLLLVDCVESLRAFRGFGRIGYLLFVLEAAAAALLLNFVIRRAATETRKVVAIVVAFMLALETLAVGQASYPKVVAQRRGQALAEAWRLAGAHDVLVFAPGYTNQRVEFTNMDCWQAALKLNKATVNGYSGNSPPGYHVFLQIPTVQNARRLLEKLGLDSSTYSLVTDWPQPFKRELGITNYSNVSHGRIVPVTSVQTISLHPMEETSLPVSFQNFEGNDLSCDDLRIFLSYRVYDSSGLSVSHPESLRTPVHFLRAGEKRQVSMPVQAPSKPGIYEIRLSMVQESVAWWADLGSVGSTITLVVL